GRHRESRRRGRRGTRHARRRNRAVLDPGRLFATHRARQNRDARRVRALRVCAAGRPRAPRELGPVRRPEAEREEVSALVLPIRVYLEDTDAQGLVYNASYFRFMERARTEWLRSRGIDHAELRDEHGVLMVLSAIEMRFRAPARLS